MQRACYSGNGWIFMGGQNGSGHESCDQRHENHHGQQNRRQDTQIQRGVQDYQFYQFHQRTRVHQNAEAERVQCGGALVGGGSEPCDAILVNTIGRAVTIPFPSWTVTN